MAALPLLALPGARALVMRCFMDGCRTGDAVAQLTALPVLLLHGDCDTTVPISHSVALTKRVEQAASNRSAPVRLEVLRGCDHLHALVYPQALVAMSAFLRDAQATAQASQAK